MKSFKKTLLAALLFVPLMAAAQTTLPTTIIRDQPAGTLHDNQARSSYFYYTYSSGVLNNFDLWSTCRYVVGDDGCIYLYNPFSQLPTRSWLKLDPAGNGKFVAHLPQLIRTGVGYDDEGNETTTYYYAFPVKEYEREDGSTFCKPDTLADGTVKSELNFVYRNDSLIMTDDDFVGLMTNRLRWTGYADTDIKVGPVLYKKSATLPDGIAMQDYRMTYYDKSNIEQDIIVKLGFVGNDAYLLNPYNNSTDEVIKGTVNGTRLSFPTKQYLGANWKVTHHLFFMANTYERSGSQTNYGKWLSALDFTIDTDRKTLTTDKNNVIIINAGDSLKYALSYYFEPTLNQFVDAARVPQAPTIDAEQSLPITDTGDGIYGGVTFLLEKYDAEGNFLDPTKCYYRLYTDNSDKPYVFTPQLYTSLKENTTDIPFSLIDNRDFYNYGLPGNNKQIERSVNIYDASVKRWGVQTVYKGGGEERVSAIAWWNTDPTGVSKVVAPGKRIANTEYFDLTGRRLSTPDADVVLKVTTFADGSKHTEKIQPTK